MFYNNLTIVKNEKGHRPPLPFPVAYLIFLVMESIQWREIKNGLGWMGAHGLGILLGVQVVFQCK